MKKACSDEFLLLPFRQVDNSGQYVPQPGYDGPPPIPYVHVNIPPIPYVPSNLGQFYGPQAPPYIDGEKIFYYNYLISIFRSRI